MNFTSPQKSTEIPCRICHSVEEGVENALFHPCRCKGSLQNIHEKCLLECVRVRGNNICDICKYEFKFEKVYKSGAPQILPLKCIASRLFSQFSGIFSKLFWITYYFLKFVMVLYINGFIHANSLLSNRDALCAILLAMFGTFLNFVHVSMFRAVKNLVLSEKRIHIDFSRSRESLIGDITSTSTVTGGPPDIDAFESGEYDSLEDTSDEQDGSDSSNTEDDFFAIDEPNDLKTDIIHTLGFVWPSFYVPCIPLLHRAFSSIARKVLSFSRSVVDSSSSGILDTFLRGRFSEEFFTEFLLYLFFLLLVAMSEIIRRLCRRTYIRLYSSFLKVFLVAEVLSLYTFSALGAVVHMGMCYIFNNGRLLFDADDAFFLILVHAILGFVTANAVDYLKDDVHMRLRPGLASLSRHKSNISFHIRYVLGMSLKDVCLTFPIALAVCSIWIVGTMVFQSKLARLFNLPYPSFYVDSQYGPFLYHKVLSVLVCETKPLATLLTAVYIWLVRKIAPLFSLQNFLFNDKMDIKDKGLLVWDNNKRVYTKEDLQLVRTIRRALSDAGDPDSVLAQKYAINEKRIAKYYGKSHGRSISIFYRPKFTGALLLLLALLFFLLLQLLVAAMAIPSLALSSRLPFSRDTSFLLAFSVIVRVASILSSSLRVSIKSLCVSIYADALWPTVASCLYLIFKDQSSQFSRASLVFMIFFSLSTYLGKVLVYLLFTSLETVPYRLILLKILSLLICKVVFVVAFFFLSILWSLNVSNLKLPILSALLGGAVIYICRLVFSSEWRERVRDDYFLERSVPLNLNLDSNSC